MSITAVRVDRSAYDAVLLLIEDSDLFAQMEIGQDSVEQMYDLLMAPIRNGQLLRISVRAASQMVCVELDEREARSIAQAMRDAMESAVPFTAIVHCATPLYLREHEGELLA